VDALRADPTAWIPELSLVAEDHDGAVIAHVVCSRAWVGEEGHEVLGLGPPPSTAPAGVDALGSPPRVVYVDADGHETLVPAVD